MSENGAAMPPAADFFVAGGALRPQEPSYVTRPADAELLEAALAGEFCYVLTPRQMGKSSLMVRIARALHERGARSVIIDLTSIGTVGGDAWYLGLLSRIRSGLRLDVEVEAWWTLHAQLPVAQRFTLFLRDVVLAEVAEPVVIFIDEIDSTLSLDFRDDFFAAIRAMYNARASEPVYERLTFVLLGVATPTDLIHDRERTPFNIGRRIDLREFSFADAAPIRQGLSAVYGERAEAMLRRIFHWTNGQPYLTQRLCQLVVADAALRDGTGVADDRPSDARGVGVDVRGVGAKDFSPLLPDGVQVESDGTNGVEAMIDRIVGQTFLSDEGRKDTNLSVVQERILASGPAERRAMLRLYEQVYAGKSVADDDRSPAQNRLELYGLLTVEQGRLRVRNEIYRRVFDADWIAASMPVDRRRTEAVFAVITAILLILGGAIYVLRQPDPTCDTFAERFTQAGATADQKLTALASLFEQPDCRRQALGLYYVQSSADEQEALFTRLEDAPSLRADIETVVGGLHGMIDKWDEDLHDVRLMDAMTSALRRAEVNEGDPLLLRLDRWKEGRRLEREGDAGGAVEAYTAAIEAFPNTVAARRGMPAPAEPLGNPALYFDRARAQVVIDREAWERRMLSSIFLPSDLGGDDSGSEEVNVLADLDRVVHLVNADAEAPNSDQVDPSQSEPLPQEPTRRPVFLSKADTLRAVDASVKEAPPMTPLARTLDAKPEAFLGLAHSLGRIVIGEPLGVLEDHTLPVESIAFSPDGTLLASGSRDGTVILWDVERRQRAGEPLKGHSDAVNDVAFSPDGRTLAVRTANMVVFWDVESRQRLGEPLEVGGWGEDIAFIPGGDELATAGDTAVSLWDWEQRQRIGEPLEGHTDTVRNLAISPDGKTLASGSDDKTIILWQVPDDQPLPSGDPLSDYGYGFDLAFSPDGLTLAYGSTEGEVIFWDLASRQRLPSPIHEHAEGLAISPDGRTLASGHWDNTIFLWDIESGQRLGAPLEGHTAAISGLAFSPDGKTLASASEDATVILWDLASPRATEGDASP